MDNSDILDFMHLGGFSLRRPELLPLASKEQIRRDLQSELPNFVFVYEKELAKDYLFNFYAYLEYVGCRVYWQDKLSSDDVLARAVFLVPASRIKDESLDKYRMCRFVPLYPGPRGKKAIATQVFGLISGLQKLGGGSSEANGAHIFLDTPEGEDKWLLNLSGFLSYWGISSAWEARDDIEDGVFIGHHKPACGDFIDIGEGEAIERKLRVFKALQSLGYVVRDGDGWNKGPKIVNTESYDSSSAPENNHSEVNNKVNSVGEQAE